MSESSSEDNNDLQEDFFIETQMRLKPNAKEFPLWICSQMQIYVETENEMFEEVTEILNRIAESVSRLQFIHEYCLTDNSLMTAFSFGMTSQDILDILERYAKNYIPDSVRRLIKKIGEKNENYRIVLSTGKVYLQGESREQMENVMDEKFKMFYEGGIKEVTEESELGLELGLDRTVFLIEIKPDCVFRL